jgi:ketosteroid isomerase-like protein
MRSYKPSTGACLPAAKIAGVATVTLWLASSLLPIRAQAPDSAEVALLKKLEDQRIQAGVRKDTDTIAAATADDYVQIDLEGNAFGKAEAMRRIRSSRIQLKSNTIDDLNIRIYGNTAVVTGRSTAKGTIDGNDFPRVRYSRVYVKRDGQWKVVLFQLTRIAGEQ